MSITLTSSTEFRSTQLQPRLKLNAANVREIRAQYFAALRNQRELGNVFGVTERHIGHIVTFNRWRNI